MAGMHMVRAGRVYDQRMRSERARMLVDRIWPRV
jgi:uncharacterized protein YeaO (DUF488 family)